MTSIEKNYRYLEDRLSPMERGLLFGAVLCALAGAGVLWVLIWVLG